MKQKKENEIRSVEEEFTDGLLQRAENECKDDLDVLDQLLHRLQQLGLRYPQADDGMGSYLMRLLMDTSFIQNVFEQAKSRKRK